MTMRTPLKMTLAALASLAFIPTASTAYTVKAPFPGTVTATTYTASGAFHGAVDLASGQCGYWGVTSGLVGSVSWNVIIQSTENSCVTGVPTQNEARHVFADGTTYRIRNFNRTASSYSRTCDRCELGNEGVHTHIQVDKNGTKDTSWYSSYTTKGEVVDTTETLGVF
jgi:hypothetical protein